MASKPRVINKNYSSRYAQRRAVYVGRPSKWGNPFPVPRESMRDEAIAKYERHTATRLINGALTSEDFKELDGKDLMCFCAPKRCHGDVILKLHGMSHEQRIDWANATLSDLHR
jgi:hypothetical protein